MEKSDLIFNNKSYEISDTGRKVSEDGKEVFDKEKDNPKNKTLWHIILRADTYEKNISPYGFKDFVLMTKEELSKQNMFLDFNLLRSFGGYLQSKDIFKVSENNIQLFAYLEDHKIPHKNGESYIFNPLNAVNDLALETPVLVPKSIYSVSLKSSVSREELEKRLDIVFNDKKNIL